MKIVFNRAFNGKDRSKLEQLNEWYTLIFQKDHDEESFNEHVKNAEVIAGHKIPNELIEKAQNLRLIQILGAGVDRNDLGFLKGKNIVMCNSHSNASAVAEHAIALLLSLIKKVPRNDQLFRHGVCKFNEEQKEEIRISDTLHKKTVGILGYGNIGKKIAQFLKGFDVKILALKKYVGESEDKNVEITTNLQKVLTKSDHIIIALPLTKDTKNLISEKEFLQMKNSATITNIARGEIILKKDLYYALKKKTIRSAAIDVWYDDFRVVDDKRYPSIELPFHELQNIVLSPYRAWNTDGSLHLDGAIENLKRFAQGKELMNKVDVERGY